MGNNRVSKRNADKERRWRGLIGEQNQIGAGVLSGAGAERSFILSVEAGDPAAGSGGHASRGVNVPVSAGRGGGRSG